MRNAAGGKQQGRGLLQHRKVVAFAQEAVGVVVFDECQYGSGVGVEEVVYEVIVYAVQSLEPSFGLFILGGVYLVKEAEVHNGLEVTVLGG